MRIPDHRILLGKLFNDKELKKQTIELAIVKLKKHPEILKILEDVWSEKIGNGTLKNPQIYFVPHLLINGPIHQLLKIISRIGNLLFNTSIRNDNRGIHDCDNHVIYVSVKSFDHTETFTHELIHYLSVNKVNNKKQSGFKKDRSWRNFNELCTDYFARYCIMGYPLKTTTNKGPYLQLKNLVSIVNELDFLKWYLYGEYDRILFLFKEYANINEADFLELVDDTCKTYDIEKSELLDIYITNIKSGYYKKKEE